MREEAQNICRKLKKKIMIGTIAEFAIEKPKYVLKYPYTILLKE